jgi:hypothetical protein
MSNEQILMPMLGMMFLTAVVWFVLYARRIPAMRKAGKPVQTYTELPVLFYALCLYLYVTATAQSLDVFAAWLFLLFRVIHSAIHCTVNIVMARFLAYCAAALALWFMLGRALWGILQTGLA